MHNAPQVWTRPAPAGVALCDTCQGAQRRSTAPFGKTNSCCSKKPPDRQHQLQRSPSGKINSCCFKKLLAKQLLPCTRLQQMHSTRLKVDLTPTSMSTCVAGSRVDSSLPPALLLPAAPPQGLESWRVCAAAGATQTKHQASAQHQTCTRGSGQLCKAHPASASCRDQKGTEGSTSTTSKGNKQLCQAANAADQLRRRVRCSKSY